MRATRPPIGSMNMPYSYLVTAAERRVPSISTLIGAVGAALAEPARAQTMQALAISL
ncbi:hypothetical protein [Caulobacter segnis]|uniref:hypothetical protein n=1 Tax=Caulobacter segnis TaxID=88688 RepID=UPI001FCB4F30|nr:hypothetical protein [Caulobacter segnis]